MTQVEPDQLQLFHFFESSIRASLFSGFLAISGFLMTAHTFLVTHMKEKLYDNDIYKERILAARRVQKLSHLPAVPYYGTLRNLSKLMMWSVFFCLITSGLQVSLGLYPSNKAAIVCIGCAIIAFILLVANVVFIALNLKGWFDDLEDQKKDL